MKYRYKRIPKEERKYAITKSERLRKKRRIATVSRYQFKKRGQPRKKFDLRYIGIMLRYTSVKHGFFKRDFEVILYVYNLREFTREDFEKAATFIYGRQTRVYRRFFEKGYFREEQRVIHHERRAPLFEKTGKLLLSKQIEAIVMNFYRINKELYEVDDKPQAVDVSPRVMAILNKMDREVEDIESGRKKADEIIKVDDNEQK